MPGQILAELKQTKPFPNREEEALVSLARTWAVFEHAGNAFLARFDVTRTQYNVLRILRGSEPGGLCRGEITDRLIAEVPDVTRLLDRMEAAGLVTRTRGQGEDRRHINARISKKGLKLLAQIDQPLAEFVREQLGHMQPARVNLLIDLLAEARQAP